MIFRTTFCATALGIGLLLSLGLGAPAASACEGTECQTAGRPLDLKEFMRQQAASTRTPEAMSATRGKARHHARAARSGRATDRFARTHHSRHRPVTAQNEPETVPTEPASAFATRSSPGNDADVHVVSADELNDIDRAAGPAPAETTGKASANVQDVLTAAQDVQMVVENDFNEIDRKAGELVRPAAAATVTASEVVPRNGPSPKSWMQWLWSAIGAAFVMLAGVARYWFA